MTGKLVVDSSFMMAIILPDERRPCLGFLWEYVVYVPAIFYLECSNVLHSALKRNRISGVMFEEYLEDVRILPFEVDNHSSLGASVTAVMRLARAFDLSAYDASYLELSIRLNAKLASNDKKLVYASRQNNIQILLSTV